MGFYLVSRSKRRRIETGTSKMLWIKIQNNIDGQKGSGCYRTDNAGYQNKRASLMLYIETPSWRTVKPDPNT